MGVISKLLKWLERGDDTMAEQTTIEQQVDETVKIATKTVEDIKKVEADVKKATKSVEQLVAEVIKGVHGTGRERMLSLGHMYEAVQHEVNQLIKKGEVK
jgi:hypothetical protein